MRGGLRQPVAVSIPSKDIVPLSRARAELAKLCEEIRSTGGERVITGDGESYVALIAAERLDYYHRPEREHIHVGLLEEAVAGLGDLKAGKTLTLARLKLRCGR